MPVLWLPTLYQNCQSYDYRHYIKIASHTITDTISKLPVIRLPTLYQNCQSYDYRHYIKIASLMITDTISKWSVLWLPTLYQIWQSSIFDTFVMWHGRFSDIICKHCCLSLSYNVLIPRRIFKLNKKDKYVIQTCNFGFKTVHAGPRSTVQSFKKLRHL